MNTNVRQVRITARAALCCALISSPAIAATSPGVVTLNATISDFSGSTSSTSGQRHDVVVWVAKADGTFIKTLWKQGPAAFDHEDWVDHFVTWNNARTGSTDFDGFTGATAQSYAPPNNPITVTWNCKDASNNFVEDGNYQFFIQYAESKNITVNGVSTPEQGPVALGLTWTKGPASQSLTPPNEGTYGSPANGNNFTNLSIEWNYATVPPTITSAAPPSSGSQGTPYNHTLSATGSAQITYSVSSGALPTGLTLSSSGVITGAPLVAGTFTGTITAENGVLPNADLPFSITIEQAIVFTSNPPPANGNLVSSYNHTCTVIGTAPVTFSVDDGILPPGLTLSPTGLISGTPTQLGTFTGEIKAHNGIAPDATQDFAIVISQATSGSVTLTATISDYTGYPGTSPTLPTYHDVVVWVTNSSGKFIKTLWKQGPASFTHKDWVDHFVAWNTARNGSTSLDGFTSATATDYTSVANNPLVVTWNCQDENGKLVDDGDYKFYIQYGEHQSGAQGALTSGLTWHKGLDSSRIDLPSEGAQGAPVNGFNFTGISIDWDSSEVPASEVVVEQPVGTNLADGTAVTACGKRLVGTSGPEITFTIRNTGNIDLTDLVITKDGSNAGDFEVSQPELTTIPPTQSTTFTVAFTPTAAGARSATIHIASNDEDDTPFDIFLTGTGTLPPAPEITVMQPLGTKMQDGTAKRLFGTVTLDSKKGRSMTFTIKNEGTAPLTGIRVRKSGDQAKAYIVEEPDRVNLAPGASAKFKVTFKPVRKGINRAALQIKSNDANENPFDIKLVGEGTK